MTSSNQRVSSTLRSVIENGYAWPSAGIIGAAANLLDDVSLLLGRLAECFADDEQEFADIKLMRDRLDDVDSRERHVATDESARRHAVESDCLRRFAEWAAGAACDDEYAPRMVKHIAAIAKDALAGNSDIAGYPTGISSRVETNGVTDEQAFTAAAVRALRGHRWCGDQYPENGWPDINTALALYAKLGRSPLEPEVARPQLEWEVTYDVVAYNESWGGYGDNASKNGLQSAEEAVAYAKSCAAHLNAEVWQRTKPKSVVCPPSIKIWPAAKANGEKT